MRRYLAVTFALLLLPALTSAQSLVERIPEDAIFYLGWRGSEALGPAYANSHLAAVVNASNFQGLIDQTIPQLLAKLPPDKPEQAANIQAALPIFQHLWKRPTAVFIASGTDKRGQWEPRVALICDAGAAAPDFHRSLTALVAQAKGSKTPIRTALDGQIVVVTIGYEDAMAAIKPKTSLRDSTTFVGAMKQVSADPAYVAFVDFGRIVKAVDQGIAQGKNKQAIVTWPKIREALGVSNLKSYISTGAFDGKDWSTRSFLDAPAPRTGLLSLLGDGAMPASALQSIPKSAAYLMVLRFDPGKVLADLRATLATSAPQASQSLEKGLTEAAKFLGRDVRDILDPLGDHWALYADAGVGGLSTDGLLLVSEVDDAAKAEAALSGLVNSYVNLAANQHNAQFQVFTSDTKLGDDLSVHLIQAMGKQIAWMIKDKRLYLGFKPEAVGAATLVSKAGGGTFTDNEKFKALRTKLGVDLISGLEFSDLPQTAPQKHAELIQALMVINMFAAGQGVQIPQNLLPPLNVLQQHLSPAGSFSWADASGWHRRAISPFPGSGIFASQQVDTIGVGGSALAVSILLPSLNRARETANRVKCASNERQIGQAILLYSNDNRGKYPPDLAALIKTQDITVNEFICPSSDNAVPPEVAAGDINAKAAWVNAHSSYVYVGKGMNNAAGADTVVLYEKTDDHDKDGVNILWGDGHVSWEAMPAAQQLINPVGAK
jgi:prepilin-type processing-associated H-X9-DG protein